MNYQYDVFISYSSADRPWADKLFDSLSQKGIRVFLDQKRLDMGKAWEPALAQAVQSSQHMIVLWTNNANTSSWVRRELGIFETLNDPNTKPAGVAEDRWYSFLLLEGDNPAYTNIQGNAVLKNADAYLKDARLKGADVVDPSLWQATVTSIVDQLEKNDDATPIPLAVLAMTKDNLKSLDPTRAPVQGLPSLNSLLDNLGIGSRDDLLNTNLYGDLRPEWRPFGQQLTIRQILDNFIDEINVSQAQKSQEKKDVEGVFKFKWQPIDPRFWTDNDVANTELTKLLSRFSVIVIDPLSLYDDTVYDGFVTLSPCFNSDYANILTLTPFSLPQPFVNLRALVERRGRPFFNYYLDPPVPPVKYANLGINLGNESELRRLVRFGVGQYVRAQMPPNKAFSQ
jgi:hypothetical protein